MVRDYTINYNLLKDIKELPELLANLSKKANIFILARDINTAEIQEFMNVLTKSRVRQPMITNKAIGEVISDRELLKCILSSI